MLKRFKWKVSSTLLAFSAFSEVKPVYLPHTLMDSQIKKV